MALFKHNGNGCLERLIRTIQRAFLVPNLHLFTFLWFESEHLIDNFTISACQNTKFQWNTDKRTPIVSVLFLAY